MNGIDLTHPTDIFEVMSIAFQTGSVELEGRMLRCGLLELDNAVLALFWEGDKPKLGSTTIILPGAASSQLLGDRDQMLGRVLGTHLASKYNKMSLVSTHFSRGHSGEVGKTLLDLVKRIMEENK